MLSLVLILMAMFISTSPLKFSFILMLLSIWVAVMSLLTTSNLFPVGGVILSFSTGMMVLFCYCASMILFEKKNLQKLYLFTVAMLMLVLVSGEKMSEMTGMPTTNMKYQLQFLMVAIMLVVMSMLSVNKSMFNPSKSNMSMY